MANYFDRFDQDRTADLTKPLGGLDKPQTRAQLDALAPAPIAAPGAPGEANYFDRFDGARAKAPDAPSTIGDGIYSALGWDPKEGVLDNVLGTDQWGALKDRIGLATGAIDPATYRGRGPVQTQQTIAPYRETNLERIGDVGRDAIEYTPAGFAARGLAQMLPGADDYSGVPGADNSVAAQQARAHDRVALGERERRANYAARTADDPFNRDEGLTPGNIERFGADAVGMLGGGTLGDPTNLIAPGRSLLMKMLGQAGIGAGVDVATQLGEMPQGVRDDYDPLQTGMVAAAGAVIPGIIEGVPRLREWWKARGKNVDDVPDEALVSGTLDGTIGDSGLTPDQVHEMLRGSGSGMEQFSSPDIAAAAAQRAAAAQGRTAPNFADGMPAGIGSKALGKRVDAIRAEREQPGFQAPPRVIPDDTAIIAAPEGNIRTDDAGGQAGLDRNRAVHSEIIKQAEETLGHDPVMRVILDSNVSPEVKAAAVLQRMDKNRQAAGDDGMDAIRRATQPDPRSAISEPTPERAAEAVRRGADPHRTAIEDITAGTESNHRRYGPDGKLLTSKAGAMGEMQVMGPTSRDPGYGVRPAANDSPDELARVGRDYIHALREHYHGDMRKAWSAYNDGPGSVDGAIAKHGADWFDHMPAETRAYTNKNMAALGGREGGPDVYRAGDYSASAGGKGDAYTFDAYDANSGLRRNTTDNMGRAEDPNAPRSAADFELERPGARGPDMATGDSTRPFKMGPGNEGFEADARARADEATAKRQADLEAEWEQRRKAKAEAENSGGFSRKAQDEAHRRGEEQTRGNADTDPHTTYGGKYDQRPHKDGEFWRTTDDGYVAGKAGLPVAFRTPKEAAKWAAKNEMGGDFEMESYGSSSRNGSQRIVLKRRSGSTYGSKSAAGAAETGAGRDFQGKADYDGSATVDSAGKALRGPEPIETRGASETTNPRSSETPAETAGGASGPAAARPSAREPIAGAKEQVVTARGRPVDTQFEVHEARDLIDSGHPDFDQRFQPRDRAGRSSSDAQIADISSKLDPEQLHSSRQAAQGAPIVGPDRMVESGNGRVASIRRAYEMHPERAKAYRDMIEARGHDTAGFDQPVLVRKRTTHMDDGERGAFVREANERDTMSMSSTEQAKADSGAMSSDTLKLYRGGAVSDAGNRDFARRWIEEVATPAERNTLMQADGSISADGLRRMRSSLLAKAFDDADLVAKIVEDPDTEIRAIGNVLTDASPGFAALRERVKAGDLPADYDITGKVAEAANLIARARNEGKRVGDLVRQDDMFGGRTDPVTEAVTKLMFKDAELTKPRSAADMAEGFRHYLDDVSKHSDTDMFGGGASPARAVEVLDAARGRLEAKRGGENRSLFQRVTDVTRRGFLKGAGATAAGFTLHGKLYAQTPQLTGILARTVDRPVNLGAVLARIKSTTTNPEFRALATRLEKLVGDVKVTSENMYGGVLGMTNFDKDGKVQVRLGKPVETETDHAHGWNERTVLHEATHAALLQEYGFLSTRLANNPAELLAKQGRNLEATPRPHAQEKLDQLKSLWEEYGRAVDKARENGSLEKLDKNGQIENASESPDELVAYIVEPDVQAFMRQARGPVEQKGLWDRMVDWVRGMFGMPPTPAAKTLLDDVLDARNGLLDAAIEHPTERVPGKPEMDENQRLNQRINNDEKGWDRVVDLEGLKGDVDGIRKALGDPLKATKSFFDPMKRVISAGVFSNDARLRGLASKFKSDGIRELADMFNAEAGKGDRAVGRTYHEAVQRASITRTQQAFEALEPHLQNKAALGRIVELLRSPTKAGRATVEERATAQSLRDLLKETLEYRKDAGESIGDVSDGYFPRILNEEKVIGGQDKFLAAAEKLYRNVGADDPAKAAKDWFGHIFDTYAGLDGGLGFGRMSSDGIGARTAKARQFGKEADTLLADFYHDDPMTTLASYFSGSARKAEHTRRFGVKGREGSADRLAWERQHGPGTTQLDVLERRIKGELRSTGQDPQGALKVIESVMRSNLGQMGTKDPFARTAVSYLHTWNQLAKMDRVTVSSLGDLTMGFVRGGPKYGFSFLKDHLQETVRHIRRAPPSDAARWAEAIGVANDAFVNQVLTARAGMEGATAGSQKVLTNFYKAVGIHQFTEGGRIAATKMAQRMIYDFAHDLDSTSARVRSRATLYMKELGVQDPEAFAKELRSGTPSRAAVLSDKGFAADYGTAVYRAVQQTILMPSRAEKPTWSAHPVGSMLFSLMSYSYGFKKNVLDRSFRLAKTGVKEGDMHLLIPAASLSIMAAFQALNDTYLRPALFGSSYDFQSESPTEAMLRVSDRAGFLGAASPIVNAIKAVRYDRSLLESLSGPVIGSVGNAAQKVLVEPFSDRNSPNTDTAERNAAAAFYDAVLEPAIDGIAAARLKGLVRSAVILGTGNKRGGIMPGDKSAFVDTFGGPDAQDE